MPGAEAAVRAAPALAPDAPPPSAAPAARAPGARAAPVVPRGPRASARDDHRADRGVAAEAVDQESAALRRDSLFAAVRLLDAAEPRGGGLPLLLAARRRRLPHQRRVRRAVRSPASAQASA